MPVTARVADLIGEVRRAGGTIRRDGDMIELAAPAPLPRDLIERIRQAKPGLLAALDEAKGCAPGEKPSVETRKNRPLTLRDGRKLHRFRAVEIPPTAPEPIIEAMNRARRLGAVLIADGRELIVVEPRAGLPRDILATLSAEPGAVIAALRGEHRARTKAAQEESQP